MTRPYLYQALPGGIKGRARVALLLLATIAGYGPAIAADDTPAKQLFGAVTLPSKGTPQPEGFYSKGCIAGAVALPADGPTWQAMRLSRNRRYGHPDMIHLLENFSQDAEKLGWGTGILVGDIGQPRGGPMASGHASHQIGLDADVWFTPKPATPLSVKQREDLPFTTLLDTSKFLTVDPKRWSPTHAKLLMQAASYPQVQRIFVNPAIKKKMCDTWTGDRTNLGKLRPYYGHDSHFHIRLRCPAGAKDCKPQAAIGTDDGCGKQLSWWYSKEPWAPPKKDPNKKPPPPPKPMTLAGLPKACAAVLSAPTSGVMAASAPADVPVPAPSPAPDTVPVPAEKPAQD
ncbi:penicillin-insensitive murein endopeptidase [Rhizobium halophytocola]|uniref:Penicillin-insensitive murein endopeptidase n=1 Tax=Rhizobium halophytocola TaxID=735519 RepID=A0ABS4E1A1_9HYPH|nr:penicillin-insensitive murein endopeptidase [Rhizobium halophytocola]MBP1851711.1 penicillin-insensitive murein endopeptidase [Rhizobium halophytocola]